MVWLRATLPLQGARIVGAGLLRRLPLRTGSCPSTVSIRACATARPRRSQVLQHRPKPADTQDGQDGEAAPVRYGPLDVDLKPRDQLRPLLPTWNPPPTRPPRPADLEMSTRLRLRKDDRWWAATVRELQDTQMKVGYDGWPSRHDENVPLDSDRLYLHESFHPDYEAPPPPQRYVRPVPTDEEGNPLPLAPRPPRPRAFDPEKERLKRALRPPLPYNPEKERLKRLLRGQYAPPIEESPAAAQGASFFWPSPDSRETGSREEDSGMTGQDGGPSEATASTAGLETIPAATPSAPAQLAPLVEWIEVEGGTSGARAFRSAGTGEVRVGAPPSGWVELRAANGGCYYWHVGRNVTQWERPQQ